MDNFMDKLAQKLNAQEMIKANSAADAEKMKRMQLQIEEYDTALQEMRKLGLKHAENLDKFNSLVEEANQKIEEIAKDSINKIDAVQVKDDEITQIHTKLKELEELFHADQKEMQEISKRVEAFAKNNEETFHKIEGFAQKNEENYHKIEGFAQKNEENFHIIEGFAQKNEENIHRIEALVQKNEENFHKIEALAQKNEENFYKIDEISQKSDEAFSRINELFKKNEEYIHSEDVKVYRNVQAVVVEEAEKQTEIVTRGQKESGKKSRALIVIGVISLIGILANVFLNFAQMLNWKLF